MEQTSEFGPAYQESELRGKGRTSSNNMFIYNVKFVELSQEEQVEVEEVLEVF